MRVPKRARRQFLVTGGTVAAILVLLSWLPWPTEFITNGQLYVLACGTPLFLLLAGFIYSVYGQTTRERFAV